MPAMATAEIERMLAPNWLDKAIGVVSPGWGAKRVIARREFTYEAARNTRLRNSASRLQGPEDYTAFPDRLQLIRQMRDLRENFGLFQSIESKLAMYCFGQLRYQALTGEKAVNDAYEARLAERFKNLDITGRHNLRQIVGIAFQSQLTDGDFLLKWQRVAGDLRLVGIEGDRLGGIIMGSPLPDYFQGIQVDPATGIPLTYKVYDRTKANSYVNPSEIPASDCMLYFDPFRIDQYRGVTPFASVINEARDLKELMEAVRIGTKFENYHAAIAYTPNGQPIQQPADFISESNSLANGQPMLEQELKYGLIQAVPTSSKIEFLKSDRPSGQFQAYLEALIRLLGTPLNLSYGFIYSLLGLSGPAVRMGSQQDLRTIKHHQQNMTERVLDRVKDTLLMDDFANGILPYRPNWRHGRWQFAPSISIDAGRDSAAMINEWKNGLRSKASIYAEDGDDAEEQEMIILGEAERTLDRAIKISEDKNVPLEVALTLLEVRTPNGWIPRNAPEENVSDSGQVTPIAPAAPAQPSGSAFNRIKKIKELAAIERPRTLKRRQ